jgi:hypothetical protein
MFCAKRSRISEEQTVSLCCKFWSCAYNYLYWYENSWAHFINWRIPVHHSLLCCSWFRFIYICMCLNSYKL